MVTISTSSLSSITSFPPHHLIGQKLSINTSSLPQNHIRFRPIRISAVHAASVEKPPRSHIASSASLYDVLGVHMGATCQEIKQAYRRLARVSHPDVASSSNGGGESSSSSSADEFMRIHAAYATLSDSEKRANYDRTLFQTRRPASSPFAMSMSSATAGSPDLGFARYTRRRWETDQCW